MTPRWRHLQVPAAAAAAAAAMSAGEAAGPGSGAAGAAAGAWRGSAAGLAGLRVAYGPGASGTKLRQARAEPALLRGARFPVFPPRLRLL